jgi:glycerophosphoryl diester phosphodiesterase
MDVGWLFERPIAHRGLHRRDAGIIENSAAAVSAAIAHGFAIEVDIQMSADGEALVVHDAALERLTGATGPVSARRTAELCALPLIDSGAGDRLWTLPDLLDLVAGRAPLIVEIKTQSRDGARLARRAAELLSAYNGPAAAKSFDPRLIAQLRRAAPDLPRGIIGCAFADDDPDWRALSATQRLAARNLLHWPWTRPHFLSWHVHDLPRRAVGLVRAATAAPVMAWTVRTPAEQARAALYADQMIFEGFTP